jgi:hypothetical protein
LLVAPLAFAATPAVQPLAPGAKVAGKRVDAYPALWWQWLDRKRWGARASQDPTGAQCGLNQDGDVWFLAATDGTDAARRRCAIPEGKHIFLPVITMMVSSRPGETLTCDQVKRAASANNDHAVATEISVDGARFRLDGLRMRSDCFNAYEFADYLDFHEFYGPSATDGYWLMLPPLSKGKHVLRVHARYDNKGADLGDLEQDFEYELDIGGKPPTDEEQEDPDSGNWLQT